MEIVSEVERDPKWPDIEFSTKLGGASVLYEQCLSIAKRLSVKLKATELLSPQMFIHIFFGRKANKI